MIWKQTSTVGAGGRVEVIVPELRPGETVRVLVERSNETENASIPSSAGKREMGFLKGKIWMADDFDAPLDDFSEYM